MELLDHVHTAEVIIYILFTMVQQNVIHAKENSPINSMLLEPLAKEACYINGGVIMLHY